MKRKLGCLLAAVLLAVLCAGFSCQAAEGNGWGTEEGKTYYY